jgi:hypothetical protein
MRVFQIATGEPGRDYRELFIDHDLMILGSGSHGSAAEHDYGHGAPNSADNQVNNFYAKPRPGDRILMRLAHEVIGVGQIPAGEADSAYFYDESFKCVYGWDLSHCRRVIWAEGLALSSLKNVYRNAKQKPSFTEVHEASIVDKVRTIGDAHFSRPLKPMLSIKSGRYEEEELGVELFRAGISNRNIQDILLSIKQAERLGIWYKSASSGRSPSEHEVVSHIVLSLFLGLGWSHQQIAVEWQKVDMAFFKTTPTVPENCVMVLEAKGLDRPLLEHFDQPQQYCQSLGLRNVRYIVLTNGKDLFVYERGDHGWATNPVGYISLTRIQKQYALPRGTSPVETLVRLQPNLI